MIDKLREIYLAIQNGMAAICNLSPTYRQNHATNRNAKEHAELEIRFGKRVIVANSNVDEHNRIIYKTSGDSGKPSNKYEPLPLASRRMPPRKSRR